MRTFTGSVFRNSITKTNLWISIVKDIDGANICIVKSDPTSVRLAMTKNGTLWLHDGTNRVDSISYEVSKYGHLMPQPFCKNDRIFVGTFIAAIVNWTLAIYFSRNFRDYYWGENEQKKVIRGRICLRREYFQRTHSLREDTLASPFYSTWVQATSQHVKLFIRSKDNEMIGQLLQMGNMETTSSAAFLDEFTIVYGCRNKFLQKIAFGDTRKLDRYFDAVCSKFCCNLVITRYWYHF
jgi:hypothetical protein